MTTSLPGRSTGDRGSLRTEEDENDIERPMLAGHDSSPSRATGGSSLELHSSADSDVESKVRHMLPALKAGDWDYGRKSCQYVTGCTYAALLEKPLESVEEFRGAQLAAGLHTGSTDCTYSAHICQGRE